METITHYAVNWTDGMKVSSQNFFDQENHLYDVIRDARAIPLTDWNYGILPSTNSDDAIRLELLEGKLLLHRCQGITAGGNRIEIVTDLPQQLTYSVTELKEKLHLSVGTAMKFIVLVKTDPYGRVPCKAISTTEQPARHPWAFPRYQLEVMKEDTFNHLESCVNVLPIGKLIWDNGRFSLHQRFIPPCTSLQALPTLEKKYEAYRANLANLYEATTRATRKIKAEGQSNLFNANIFLFAIDIGQFLGNSLDEFKLTYRSKPPIYLLEYMARLARAVDTSLARLREEELILNYISNNSGKTPEDFKAAMRRVITFGYNHLEIVELLDVLEEFLTPLVKVFQVLDEARLHTSFAAAG